MTIEQVDERGAVCAWFVIAKVGYLSCESIIRDRFPVGMLGPAAPLLAYLLRVEAITTRSARWKTPRRQAPKHA